MSLQDKFSVIQRDVSLKDYSAFKVGGPADLFYECNGLEGLPEILKCAQESKVPVLVIGGGTNTIFSEKGFRGLVVRITSNSIFIDKETVTADAGVVFNALILQTVKAGLVGMENLFGIPGSFGGAIRGNAGAHGTEIKDLLRTITYYNPKTHQIATAPKTDFNFNYRSSSFKFWQQEGSPRVILKATLDLTHDPERAEISSREILQIQAVRNKKYPSEPNCGSFFKNLPGIEASEIIRNYPDAPRSSGNIPAGWLSEQAGCKGLRVGGAEISKKHGNFVVNLGDATLQDVIELRDMAKKKISEKFDVVLEEEVQLISETGAIKPEN